MTCGLPAAGRSLNEHRPGRNRPVRGSRGRKPPLAIPRGESLFKREVPARRWRSPSRLRSDRPVGASRRARTLRDQCLESSPARRQPQSAQVGTGQKPGASVLLVTLARQEALGHGGTPGSLRPPPPCSSYRDATSHRGFVRQPLLLGLSPPASSSAGAPVPSGPSRPSMRPASSSSATSLSATLHPLPRRLYRFYARRPHGGIGGAVLASRL